MPPKASKRKAANGYKLPDHIPEGTIISGMKKKVISITLHMLLTVKSQEK